ncbi:MAG: hypothetical protein J2P54_15670 [Bradyrhizobiaceae bacterium]|nr:hypothetical protein [Bradyrhizobiaceae bacterium]
MRPKTIIYFEWIIFGVLLFIALQWYLIWNRIMTDGNPAFSYTYFTVQLFKSVLIATLTLLVSRRRSKIAMWVSIALFALSLVATIAAHITFETTDISDLAVSSDLAILIGKGVAYSLLFTPSARRWMNREDEKLGNVFH